MRRSLAALGVLIAMVAGALADAPFIPNARAPDYVVAMETSSFGRKTESLRSHTHHGGWTRIDTVEKGRPATRYFGHTDSVLVRLQRDSSGALSYFDIRRGDDPSPIWSHDRFKTGETRTILGETCQVWNVSRSTKTNFSLLSCVTDDGIELWRAYMGDRGEISSATATRVERRSVPPWDVRPPVEALSLKAWNELVDPADAAPASAPGDFEAVIEPEPERLIPSARYTRIVRRHFPWILIDEQRVDGQRGLRVSNEVSGFSLRIGIHAKLGLHQLVMNKFAPPAANKVNPVDLDRRETVLGETCRWFDIRPSVMDAGLHECRTADGVVLKALEISRGSRLPLAATRLTRRPVPLAQVLPPAEMVMPRSWNLPD